MAEGSRDAERRTRPRPRVAPAAKRGRPARRTPRPGAPPRAASSRSHAARRTAEATVQTLERHVASLPAAPARGRRRAAADRRAGRGSSGGRRSTASTSCVASSRTSTPQQQLRVEVEERLLVDRTREPRRDRGAEQPPERARARRARAHAAPGGRPTPVRRGRAGPRRPSEPPRARRA